MTAIEMSNIAIQYGIRHTNTCLTELIALNRSQSTTLWRLLNEVGHLQGQLLEIARILASPIATQAAEHLNRGIFALGRGWINESLNDFHKALELDQYNVAAHYFAGSAYAEAGDNEAAIRHFDFTERYAEPLPFHSTFRNLGSVSLVSAQLGLEASLKKFAIQRSAGEPDIAIEELSRTLSLNPTFQCNYDSTTFSWGSLYVVNSRGDFQKITEVVPASSGLAGANSTSPLSFGFGWEQLSRPDIPEAYRVLLSARAVLALTQSDLDSLTKVCTIDPSVGFELSLVEGANALLLEDAIKTSFQAMEGRVYSALMNESQKVGLTTSLSLESPDRDSGLPFFSSVVEADRAITDYAIRSLPVAPKEPSYPYRRGAGTLGCAWVFVLWLSSVVVGNALAYQKPVVFAFLVCLWLPFCLYLDGVSKRKREEKAQANRLISQFRDDYATFRKQQKEIKLLIGRRRDLPKVAVEILPPEVS